MIISAIPVINRMNKMFRPLLCLVLTLAVVCVFDSASAQYKQTYRPDSTTLSGISLFDATGIVETGIPGQEIALCGSITGIDTNSVIRQTVFIMQTSNLGAPAQLDLFRDTTPLLFYGPRAYAITFDGQQNFYVALGSNDNQLVLSMTVDGTFRWIRKGNHHDYYSVVMDGPEIVLLGQDESIQGLHDYSLCKVDSNGAAIGNSNMFGTAAFDLPEKVISTVDGYVMSGFTFASGAFSAMVIKADKSLNLGWSLILGGINKDIQCKDIVEAVDGSGYIVTGRSQDLNTGHDSLYAFKLDTAGNVLWSQLYGIDSTYDVDAYSIAADPLGRGYLIAGAFRVPPGFYEPCVMMIDPMGHPLWVRNYGVRDTSVQEILKDIIVAHNGSYFYTLGEYTQVDTNNQISKAIFVVKAGLTTGEVPCDSAMSVGTGIGTLIPGGSAHEEPFVANNSYNFFVGLGSNGQMNSVVNCSTIVAKVPSITDRGNSFSFVNPTAQDLILEYQVKLGEGVLILNDMQGRTLRQFPLQEGHHRERYNLGNLPQGLYFLTAKGEDWRTETKRLLIVK